MRTSHALFVVALLAAIGAVAAPAAAQPPTPAQPPTTAPHLRPPPRKGTAPEPPKVQEITNTPKDAAPPEPAPAFKSNVTFKALSPHAKVTFNLQDADLSDLVRLISNMTGKRFILPAKMRSIKATVFAPTTVTAAEAYNAFLSILEAHNLTIVPAGKYLRIVETSGVETENTPVFGEGERPPSVDRFVTKLVHVHHISADDASSLISRFKTREGTITVYAPTNLLIITDTGTQIARLGRLLEAIDVPRTGEQIWIEPIHYATAEDLVDQLTQIFPIEDDSSSSASSGRQPRRTPPGRRPTRL